MSPTRPGPGPRPPRAPWGWIEVVVLTQFLMPGLVFIPGMTWVRTATRVAAFLIPLLAWVLCAAVGPRPVGRRFPALPWLAGCCVLLICGLAHPETNSLLSGSAEAALSIAVLAPAFWAARQGPIPPRRLHRLAVLIFAANGLSALLGIAQFYRPETFNPPVIPVFEISPVTAESRYFEDASGRKVLRPCGLTDTPGSAGIAGAYAFVLGLGLALRPIKLIPRTLYLAVAAAGMAVVYLSHARVTLLISLGSLAALAGLLLLLRDLRKLALLTALGAAVFAAGMLWALREGGAAVAKRFATLLETRPTEFYQHNRGAYLSGTFLELVPARPLGAGLGRWGQPYQYFGRRLPPNDPRAAFPIEIQWTAWALQGGVPMMAAAAAALIVTVLAGLRVVRSCPDPDLSYTAALLLALNLQAVAMIFGALPFAGPIGVVFWTVAAALDAADQQLRAARRRQTPPRAATRTAPPPLPSAPPKVRS